MTFWWTTLPLLPLLAWERVVLADGTEVKVDTVLEVDAAGESRRIFGLTDVMEIPEDPADIAMVGDDYDLAHCNNLYYDPDGDLMLVTSHTFGVVFAVERSTGDVAWLIDPDGNWIDDPVPFDDYHWEVHHGSVLREPHSVQLLEDHRLLMFNQANYPAQESSCSHALELTWGEEGGGRSAGMDRWF